MDVTIIATVIATALLSGILSLLINIVGLPDVERLWRWCGNISF